MATAFNALRNIAEVREDIAYWDRTSSAANSKAADLYSDGSCIKNLGARFLSIAQVIVSIVAVPLALLTMVFAPIITLFTHGKMAARTCAVGFAGIVAANLFQIPESLIGAFFPSTLTNELAEKIEDPEEFQEEFMQWLGSEGK